MTAATLDACKRQAALRAIEFIQPGMVVGLGTGSTADHMIAALGQRVGEGLDIRGVPTSRGTADLARRHGIPLLEQEQDWVLDLALDGADQVDPQLNLVKGGGGALLKEKIVAASAKAFIVMVDHAKCVPVLGRTFPLPVEVVPFGWGTTARRIEDLTGGKAVLRHKDGEAFVTEAGHYIVDLHLDSIENPAQLERDLRAVVGVIETGLFVGRTTVLVVGSPDGVRLIRHDT